jgi:hypothetical protein
MPIEGEQHPHICAPGGSRTQLLHVRVATPLDPIHERPTKVRVIGSGEGNAWRRGEWFAVAKEAGLDDGAIALASRTPCDPKTRFAIQAGLLVLHWM